MAELELEKLFELVASSPEGAECRDELQALKNGQDSIVLPQELLKDNEEPATQPEAGRKESEDLYLLVREMTIPQKIKLALFGGKAARGLLIRDRNKQVPMFVLQNSRITEDEIVDFAKNTNLDELVFRAIANSSAYMKSYTVKHALVCNPKTPIDVSLRWIKYIHDADLRLMARSKNIPQVISSQARKLLEKRQH